MTIADGIIDSFGALKAALSRYEFHARFVADYARATILFENAANRRLRVLPMETSTLLTTVAGATSLPPDYITWRTVLFTGLLPVVELDYVHPAYLMSTPSARDSGDPRVFTIEGSRFKTWPVRDVPNVFEFHYYQKIPTVTGSDNASNWLLDDYSDAYLFGVLTELGALGRNVELAQLYKARRDEVFTEIIQVLAQTTGATSSKVRTAEYF